MEFHAMGELEYYVIAPDEGMFPATDQKGYHESAPYSTTTNADSAVTATETL